MKSLAIAPGFALAAALCLGLAGCGASQTEETLRPKEDVCWRCNGQKVCPTCHGSGQGVNQRECYACYSTAAKKSTGVCQECDEAAFVGKTPLGEAVDKAGGKPPRN